MPTHTRAYYLRDLRRQRVIRSSAILHWDSTARDLRPWYWYVIIMMLCLVANDKYDSEGPSVRQESASPPLLCLTTVTLTNTRVRLAFVRLVTLASNIPNRPSM
jgi:hypothetical protein